MKEMAEMLSLLFYSKKEKMKNKFLAGIVFLTGISLSAVAAFYSIIGLTAIFAGAYWSVIIMGTVLEISKLVSVSWLHHNWNDTPKFIKSYMLFAIVVLMFITSMGIFGFLTRAYIEQQLKTQTGASSQIQLLDNQIRIHEDLIKDLDKQISVIDSSIDKMIEKGKTKDSLAASEKQRKNRDTLVGRKNAETNKINELKTKKLELSSEVRKLEAEVGPLKYIAEFFSGKSDTKTLDIAVTYVIIIIIFVFDPLAILLLLAFNHMIAKKNEDELEIEFVEYKPRRRTLRKSK